MKAVVVECELVTPYGPGIEACWSGLRSGRTAIARIQRFSTRNFGSDCAGIIAALDAARPESLCAQMLTALRGLAPRAVPADAFPILATTVGEIDLLERSVFAGAGAPDEARPERLLERTRRLFGLRQSGIVVSSACASSTVALAHAAALIRDGARDCVLVVACDAVTEFVFAGFASLLALDPAPCRPFDRNRKGLTPGEAAGFALLMSAERARREGRRAMAVVAGWGLSNDANHMTGPSRTGDGLAAAIRKALRCSGTDASAIGAVSAHGTGTAYNDAMEMLAFRQVFGSASVPVYSIKGGIGHTMGAAGLVETVIAIRTLHAQAAPPTVNLVDVADDARGWVAPAPVALRGMKATLSTNSGFGGVNAALVLTPEAT